MDLSNLKPAKGSIKPSKRVGRGQGSGKGGTSTRGHKGAQSRSGYKSRVASEGGQMPLQRRIPKFGFKNVNRKEFTGINLDKLQELADSKGLSKVDFETLYGLKIVSKSEKFKILGRGELKAKLEVEAHAFSKTAQAAIEAAGGTVKLIEA